MITEEELQMLEDIVFDRVNAHATCDECGYSQDVEPDADYPCNQCNKGRLTSPLIKLGFA